MDVNGTPFWQVASEAGFGFGRDPDKAPANLVWDRRLAVVRLAGEQASPDFAEDEAFSRQMAMQPSTVFDEDGSFAWWDGPTKAVLASGFLPGSALLSLAPDDPIGVSQPTDMAFDRDILFVARNDGVLIHDLRSRWPDARAEHADFDAHLLAPIGGGAMLLVDRSRGSLAILRGTPRRPRGYDFRNEETFGPVGPDPQSPSIVTLPRMSISAPLEAVAIAGRADGRAAILCWDPSNEAVILLWNGRTLTRSQPLEGLRFPYSLAWDGSDAIAVLASDGPAHAPRAISYDLGELFAETDKAAPNGRVYPLRQPFGAGFCNALADLPNYVSGEPDRLGLQRLRAVSRATFARSGSLSLGPYDSQRFDCVWHRLHAELCLRGSAGLRIWALATNTTQRPALPTADTPRGWSPHLFGLPADGAAPIGSWSHLRSEIAGDSGLSDCPRQPGRAGHFEVLLQASSRQVRRLEGRYLHLHVEFVGDGQHSPELFGLRVYGHRFAYRDKYLPELYRETTVRTDATDSGKATPADFLDRFLGIFEAELTAIEGRVADGWRVTDPLAAPDFALPWLAQWVGVDPAGEVSPQRLRQRLACATPLARLNGTLGGLLAQLEIESGGMLLRGGSLDERGAIPQPGQFALIHAGGKATRALVLAARDPSAGAGSQVLVGGGVTSGRIAVVEGFRLRRTFATILGADLTLHEDPLTLGMTRSGNSLVGDTLILGEEHNDALLALFRDDLPKSLAERAAVERFIEKLAFRTLVLVRGEGDGAPAELARLSAAARKAAPAHVELVISPSDSSFIAGINALVGIDSWLAAPVEPGRARVGESEIGGGDRIEGEGQFDPRADGPAPYPPNARADGPEEVLSDSAFVLSALRSSAATGRVIDRYIWTWN